jgi:hypothetical protein
MLRPCRSPLQSIAAPAVVPFYLLKLLCMFTSFLIAWCKTVDFQGSGRDSDVCSVESELWRCF